MRGFTNVTACGNVADPIKYGTTEGGDEACTFVIASEKKSTQVVWVKVNAYGGNVRMCRERLRKGGYVTIRGELMNESDRSREQTVAIRVEEIIFGTLPRTQGAAVEDA